MSRMKRLNSYKQQDTSEEDNQEQASSGYTR